MSARSLLFFWLHKCWFETDLSQFPEIDCFPRWQFCLKNVKSWKSGKCMHVEYSLCNIPNCVKDPFQLKLFHDSLGAGGVLEAVQALWFKGLLFLVHEARKNMVSALPLKLFHCYLQYYRNQIGKYCWASVLWKSWWKYTGDLLKSALVRLPK